MTGTMEIKLNSNLETELEGNIKKGISAALEGVISRGIKACRIDDDGHLIFTLTDDNELDIGKVTGEDGVSITGISTQASSVSGGDNIVTITLSDGSITSFAIKNGAKGDPGYTPVKGVDYFDGEDGYTPIKGKDYFDGNDGYTPVKGKDYFDGNDGHTPIKGIDYYTPSEIEEIKASATPVKGRDYFDGAKGDPGDDGYTPRKNIDYFDGQDGTDGIGITNITATESTVSGGVNTVTITLSDGTTKSFNVRNGTKGESGEGSGDMSASMYDTKNKRTDIFDYVDNAVSSVPKSWNDITDKPSTFPPSTHTHSQYLTTETDPIFNASAAKGITATDISNWNAKGTYSKPSGGIPKTDLASAVQTSLGKADTALQEESDPTVPSWAKASTKPTYTAEEVGALPQDKVFWATYGVTTYAEITQAVADGKIILCWYSNRLYKYGGLSTYHYFVCDLTATASYYVRVSTSNAWSNSSSTALTNSIYVKSTQTTAESDSNVYTALRTKNELATVEGKIPTAVSQLTNDSGYLTEYTETDPTVPAYVKNITEADIDKWNSGGGLPEVTAEDEGKVLCVEDGVWSKGFVFDGISYSTSDSYSADNSGSASSGATKTVTLITLPKAPIALKLTFVSGYYKQSSQTALGLPTNTSWLPIGQNDALLSSTPYTNLTMKISYNASTHTIIFVFKPPTSNITTTYNVSVSVSALFR